MSDIDKIVKDLNKKLDKDIVFSGQNRGKVDVIPSGMLPLDAAIGVGGLPKGKIIEIHGVFSTGKTALCLAIISHFQKLGLPCAYIDAEYSFNHKFSETLGVDTQKLVIVTPETAEDAFTAMELLIKEHKVSLIVVDSVSALVPMIDASAEQGRYQIGAQAKIMSKGLMKLVGPMDKAGTIVIFINQLRQNILAGGYSPYILPGGLSLRFYSSIMLELSRASSLKSGDKLVGQDIHISVKKNKVATPGEECVVKLLYGQGFSAEADLLAMALRLGKLTKAGNTVYWGAIKIGVGENKARKFLEDNPIIAEEIKAALNNNEDNVV